MIMLNTWFECKIRYEKVMENGMNKKVTESYLGVFYKLNYL